MEINEVIEQLRDGCPKAVINSSWDEDMKAWHVLVYKVGGGDGSPGFYNDITPDLLPRITGKAIENMAGIINGFLGRA